QGMHGMQGMAAMCPMQVQGTKVEASNTDTGAALTFTTQGDVTELRRRVSAMAQMHNEHHAGQGMHAQGGAAGCACGQHEGKDQGGSGCACDHHEGQGDSGCACDHHEGQGCHCGPHAGKMGMHMPASRVTTEEVPGGIRLVFTPEDASQLDALRESVRHHAEMMSSGHCPMMQSAPGKGS
ncbi:MAG: hypothetical protein ACXU86_13705, partial [Archangium sp.]